VLKYASEELLIPNYFFNRSKPLKMATKWYCIRTETSICNIDCIVQMTEKELRMLAGFNPMEHDVSIGNNGGHLSIETILEIEELPGKAFSFEVNSWVRDLLLSSAEEDYVNTSEDYAEMSLKDLKSEYDAFERTYLETPYNYSDENLRLIRDSRTMLAMIDEEIKKRTRRYYGKKVDYKRTDEEEMEIRLADPMFKPKGLRLVVQRPGGK
jgi:hypothetical protein